MEPSDARPADEGTVGRFHMRDGWTFERSKVPRLAGYVVVENQHLRGFSLLIAPSEWASIVAHVADGGSAEAYSAAEALHRKGETT